MLSVKQQRLRTIAALTAVLMAPSLAHAAPESDDPPASDGEAKPDDANSETPPQSTAEGPDIRHEDLAAQLSDRAWVNEGDGSGTTGGVDIDPRALNRKIRRTGKVTLAGGGIAVVGALTGLAGVGLLFAGSPKRLAKLADDNMGQLPVDDEKRHRIITMNRIAPFVGFAGLGVLVAGVLTAAIARSKLKKLREQRRTSIVAFTPAPTLLGRGAELHLEVRF